MTTSGVYTLGLTFNEAMEEAFDLLQIGVDGETLNGPLTKRAKNSSNLILKEWSTQGIHLWSYTEGTLFLEVGKAKYNFNNSSVHVANDWFETTTTADTTASATSIEVSSIADIQKDDVIGVIQNDNNLFWTTVKDEPSGTTVNLTDAIPLATVSGAFARNYRPGTSTSPELVPISRILDVRRQESSDYEIPIVFQSRKDYFGLPNKEQTGTPIQAYYSRQDIAGEASGTMYVWNAAISSIPVINFTYERKLQINTAPGETLDIPDYAQQAFIWHLALKLIPKFGCSKERALFISVGAENLKNDMLAYDSAMYPIKMKMTRRG